MEPRSLLRYCLEMMRADRSQWPSARELERAKNAEETILRGELRGRGLPNSKVRGRLVAEKAGVKTLTIWLHDQIYESSGKLITLGADPVRIIAPTGKNPCWKIKDTESEVPPQIPRKIFAPHPNPSEVTLGLWSDFQKVSEDLSGGEEPRKCYVDELLSGVVQRPIEEWMREQGWNRVPWVWATPIPLASTIHLENLCQQVMEDGQWPELGILAGICAADWECPRVAESRRGSPSAREPAESQERALLSFSDMDAGGMVTVQGPPGTGKTTLIGALMAHWITRAAARGEPCPLIVVTSSNNTAVDHALASLTPDTDAGWLEDMKETWGLRLLSSQPGTVSPHQHQEKKLGRFPDVLTLAMDHLAEWERRLCEKAGTGDVRAARAKAHDHINRSAPFRTAHHPRDAFVWAIRYYQAESLLKIRDFRERMIRSGPHKGYVPLFREVLAPFFLAFGMTLHMTPRWLDFTAGIDHLIIDEAGQCPVHLALPLLSLARRAYFMGDPRQIEPVCEVAPHLSRQLWGKCGLPESRWPSFDGAVHSAISSAMAVLPDHRNHFLNLTHRCGQNLVQVLNDLCYEGKLLGARSTAGSLEFIPVEGQDEGQSAGSRFNRKEAEAVAAWVSENLTDICREYGCSPPDCLAILTPFRKQSDLLRSLLPQSGLRIGTVHVMQGQERPVILFSGVYAGGNAAMLNQKPNLLNVAVSRARDRFVVFGHPRIWRPGDTPVGRVCRRWTAPA